jgi:hypothetical protein
MCGCKMGTEWYLIDYTNKKLVELHKAYPSNINYEKEFEEQKEDIDKQRAGFFQYWHGRVIDYIDKQGPIECQIVSEHSNEFEKCRFELHWERV